MRRSSCLLVLLALGWLAGSCEPLNAAPVQPILAPVHRPVATPWLGLSRHAGLIFAGRVLRVRRLPARELREVETVEVSFHVDQAVRGVRTGQVLTIREWAGLWVAQPRYRVGERLVVFLYPPSRLGLTSPINETTARFAVDEAGRVRFTPVQRAWLGNEEWRGAGNQSSEKQVSGRAGISLNEFVRQIREVTGERP